MRIITLIAAALVLAAFSYEAGHAAQQGGGAFAPAAKKEPAKKAKKTRKRKKKAVTGKTNRRKKAPAKTRKATPASSGSTARTKCLRVVRRYCVGQFKSPGALRNNCLNQGNSRCKAFF